MRAALASLLLLTAAPAVAQDRDDQWLYRDPPGSQGPVAVFLAWDYRSVVLRVSCEGDELVFDYSGAGRLSPDGSSMALLVGEDSVFQMDTVRIDREGEARLEGRLQPSPDLIAAMAGGGLNWDWTRRAT